jgi:hypothetical protein
MNWASVMDVNGTSQSMAIMDGIAKKIAALRDRLNPLLTAVTIVSKP